MALRIEITKNWAGLFNYREGDLDGEVSILNATIDEILTEIKSRLQELNKKKTPSRGRQSDAL